jgi:hypothetical protein
VRPELAVTEYHNVFVLCACGSGQLSGPRVNDWVSIARIAIYER